MVRELQLFSTTVAFFYPQILADEGSLTSFHFTFCASDKRKQIFGMSVFGFDRIEWLWLYCMMLL